MNLFTQIEYLVITYNFKSIVLCFEVIIINREKDMINRSLVKMYFVKIFRSDDMPV